MKNGEVTTDTETNKESQETTTSHYMPIKYNMQINLEEMGKFLENHNLPRLNQEKINK